MAANTQTILLGMESGTRTPHHRIIQQVHSLCVVVGGDILSNKRIWE